MARSGRRSLPFDESHSSSSTYVDTYVQHSRTCSSLTRAHLSYVKSKRTRLVPHWWAEPSSITVWHTPIQLCRPTIGRSLAKYIQLINHSSPDTIFSGLWAVNCVIPIVDVGRRNCSEKNLVQIPFRCPRVDKKVSGFFRKIKHNGGTDELLRCKLERDIIVLDIIKTLNIVDLESEIFFLSLIFFILWDSDLWVVSLVAKGSEPSWEYPCIHSTAWVNGNDQERVAPGDHLPTVLALAGQIALSNRSP